MTEEAPTRFDRAKAAMDARPEDASARLGYYQAVADSELLVVLAAEPEDDRVEPRLFPVEGARYVLAFDTEERLAAFAEAPVPWVAIPGRALARLLAPEGLGLGLNVGVAPSSMLVPPEGVAWLVGMLDTEPGTVAGTPAAYAPPGPGAETLASALAAPLAAAGLGKAEAWLADATYEDGARALLLGIIGAPHAMTEAIAHAVQEAVAFSGSGETGLDIAFLDEGTPAAAKIAAAGRRIRVPAPAPRTERAERTADTPAAPGMDPARPPRLR